MKIRIYYTLLCYLFILFLGFDSAIAQTEKEAWLLLPSEQEIIADKNGKAVFKNTVNNDFLEKCAINKIQKVFPYSKNDTLKRLYRVSFAQEKMPVLISEKKIEHVYLIEDECENIALYNPSDPMWSGTTDTTGLWHLKKIQADLAWDITKGDSSVKIAILDTWFDVNHPDLINKMYCTYEPYSGEPFYLTEYDPHGTIVASFAAAETDGGGSLASVGFNCKIIPYKAWKGAYLQRAHHASLAMHADVLTSSAGGWTCSNNFSEIERIAVKEILDNGTVIVMPAGNGLNGNKCIVNGEQQPWRPLHPYYDNRIIIVSSTDNQDNHSNIVNGVDYTHSHYAYVDICSPGYGTMGAIPSVQSDGTPSLYLYYGQCNGTSFATPIVAGVCALLKSIDKSLTPAEIKNIIKTTADPIADAHLYPGQVGAGRVNAYKAALAARAACVVNFTDQTVTTTINITSCDINVKNVNIQNGAKLILDATDMTTIESDLEMELGAELEMK